MVHRDGRWWSGAAGERRRGRGEGHACIREKMVKQLTERPGQGGQRHERQKVLQKW